jgi:hypothetical protein
MNTNLRWTKPLLLAASLMALLGAAAIVTAGLPAGKYAAHEWGTFTSVQGGDGALLAWRPLETSRLPAFVHDWRKPGLSRQASSALAFGKGGILTLQRMETPVIYFYSEKEQTVDVSVSFPQGLITEWFPQAAQIGPSAVPAPAAIVTADKLAHKVGVKPEFSFASLLRNPTTKDSRARWDRITLLPAKQNPELTRSLPLDASGGHYLSARETDASFVRVNSLVATNPLPELEKFIFYRGVGNFSTPLFVTVGNTGVIPITLSNTGKEPLNHLFLLSVENHKAKFVYLDRIAAGQSRTLQFEPSRDSAAVETVSKALGERMTRSLVQSGLFQREAAAMIKTWQESWFAEDGVRVLYVLPRAWTDRTLPLTLDPSPRELVRVMVGRAEVLLPAAQQTLAVNLSKASEGDADARQEALKQLKKLGRFAEPALQLATKNASAKTGETGWRLFQTAAYPGASASAKLE